MREEEGVLIAAHRGTCGGNVVQNTILAYETALQHGAQLMEVDVVMSTDGDFFAFHNGYEKLVLNVDQDIREMSTTQIESLHCYNQLGEKVNQKLERVEGILKKLKGRCLINIDRSWFYWKETIEFILKQDMLDQIILKSTPDKELLEELEKRGKEIMYMPIIHNKEAYKRAMSYDLNLVAVELIFDSLDNELIKPEYIKELHDKGLMIWVNAITLNDTTILSAYLDDNNAIENGYEDNWGTLIDMGFDIIQTDWPGLLSNFIFERKK